MITKVITVSALAVLLGACSLFGRQGVEIAQYDVIKADDVFEVRAYKPLVVVKTRAKGDYKSMSEVAFMRLFDYISGENEKREKVTMTAPVLMQPDKKDGEKIAMTAPVLMEKSTDTWSMAFVLPATYTLETAPKPKDKNVFLEKMPAQRVVALRFSGFLSESNVKKKTAALREWARANGYKTTGNAVVAGYDPPWTIPFFRRNEIHIPIQ
jgi:hypothetical protein